PRRMGGACFSLPSERSSDVRAPLGCSRGRDAGRPDTPRTDPCERSSRTRFLSWMFGRKAYLRIRMQDLNFRYQMSEFFLKSRPRPAASLTPPAKLPPPHA